ncbi:type VI secretion system tip protein VgrG, partial [Xanthomonas oryzae pv. oryzae]
MDISTALAAPSQHARLIQLSSPQPDFVVERFTG